ncbi:hypothetical protein F5146DRAFT_52947 [Armillaria mellea]|nr:hypothetical protein F5146DRAFT_52947 [Armillaria mellea]
MCKRYATSHSVRYLELRPPTLQTPLTQRCTCEAQLCDHIAIDNLYRSTEPWNVLNYFPDSSVPSSNVGSHSNDTMNKSSMPNSVPFSPNNAYRSLMPVAPTPIYSNYIDFHSFNRDAGNNPTTYSYPPASSALSDIFQRPDTTQTEYRDHVDNNPYPRQPDGNAALEVMNTDLIRM